MVLLFNIIPACISFEINATLKGTVNRIFLNVIGFY